MLYAFIKSHLNIKGSAAVQIKISMSHLIIPRDGVHSNTNIRWLLQVTSATPSYLIRWNDARGQHRTTALSANPRALPEQITRVPTIAQTQI